MSFCKSCHAQIRWVQIGQSPMPVDFVPVPDGNVLLLPNGGARVLAAEARASCEVPLYKSHFATCPNAAAHRQGRRP